MDFGMRIFMFAMSNFMHFPKMLLAIPHLSSWK
jgi:hypothetical protein